MKVWKNAKILKPSYPFKVYLKKNPTNSCTKFIWPILGCLRSVFQWMKSQVSQAPRPHVS